MFADVLPLDAIWSLLCAMSVAPLGYMLGSSCSPCCGPLGCSVPDGKPRTDPATEGHWVPSGTWATGVTWTFSSSPSTADGGTWYFYGSEATSKVGGGASFAEQRDWGNICNWYSNKTTTPSSTSSLTTVLDKRATRLPPTDAVVHAYSIVNTTTTGPVTIKNAYFWNANFSASEMTTTSAAYDSDGGAVFNGSFNSGSSTVNGGATFNGSSRNIFSSTVNGGATFNSTSRNDSSSTVSGGATFNDFSRNTDNATVSGGAEFNDYSGNYFSAVVNDSATFNDSSANLSATVNNGATFNGSSQNIFSATVNGGATFNGTSRNDSASTVNDGATFNDAACSERTVGSFANCPGVGKRIFVAHPTDLPTCNGTAPDGCANFADTCGCG